MTNIHILPEESTKLMNKIQDVKMELRKNPPQKSGYNRHGKYKYYELEDIIPCIEVLFKKYDLGSWNDYNDGMMYLSIYDRETNVYKTWETPITTIKGQENGFDSGVHMKNNQSAQTYARRTLWLQALDILEKNTIESDKEPVKKPKKTERKRADLIIKPIKQEKDDEITPEMVEDILNKAEESCINLEIPFTERTAKQFIFKYSEGNKQLIQACNNKLKIITAEKLKEDGK